MVAFTRLDCAWPPGYHGHADATVVKRALIAPQGATGIKEAHLVPSLVVRSVVRGEDD